MKNGYNRYLYPKWVPDNFRELVDNINYEHYENVMMELMAADLRTIALSLGEKTVQSIKKGDIKPDHKLKTIIDNLVRCLRDPISNEDVIFSAQKDLAILYKIFP